MWIGERGYFGLGVWYDQRYGGEDVGLIWEDVEEYMFFAYKGYFIM